MHYCRLETKTSSINLWSHNSLPRKIPQPCRQCTYATIPGCDNKNYDATSVFSESTIYTPKRQRRKCHDTTSKFKQNIKKKSPNLNNFSFQKSHSDLKIIIFYENLQKSSNYFKRKFAKKKIRNKNMLTKLVGTSKLGKSVFDLVKWNLNILFTFFSFLAGVG